MKQGMKQGPAKSIPEESNGGEEIVLDSEKSPICW